MPLIADTARAVRAPMAVLPLATEPSVELLRQLLRLALYPPSLEPARAARALRRAGRDSWPQMMRYLADNRLLSPVGGALRYYELESAVPPTMRRQLGHAYEIGSARNARRMQLYAELAEALQERGVAPVLLKSTALVALLYPEQVGHQMNDVDCWIDPDQRADVEAVLEEQGYRAAGVPDHGHTVDYLHPSGGLRLDLHLRFDLFDGYEPATLLTRAPAAWPGIEAVRLLEPDAMLTHLIVHLNEHRRAFGYQLRWVLDVGLALRHWRDELSVARLFALAPHRAAWCAMLRAARFFQDELDVEAAPESLLSTARDVEPFTLTEVLRSQRVDPWPLNIPRGWLRLAATAARLKPQEHRRYPQLLDVVERRRDVLREQRALERTPVVAAGGAASTPLWVS